MAFRVLEEKMSGFCVCSSNGTMVEVADRIIYAEHAGVRPYL